MPSIVIFSMHQCPYCDMAKQLLLLKGHVWQEIDITGDPVRRDDMIKRSGRQTVPQIFIDQHHVGGFDDLTAIDRLGKLDQLLGS